jgi:hypothetical protein
MARVGCKSSMSRIGKRLAALLSGAGLLSGCGRASGVVHERAAHEFNCPEEDIQVESIGGTTYRASGCGEVAVYTCSRTFSGGYAIPCVRDDAVPSSAGPTPQIATEAPRAAPASRLGDPPDGAGGFAFGMTDGDAKKSCEQSGHGYSKVTAETLMCDGLPVDVGTPAKGRLRFCAEKLCAVSLELVPVPNETFMQTLLRFKALLAEKYGEPTKSETQVPLACNRTLGACLADERAKVRFEWRWPSRQGIVAWLGTQPHDAGRVGVHVEYSSPALFRPKAPGL